MSSRVVVNLFSSRENTFPQTRKHSSRMRTAHLLTGRGKDLPSGGGVDVLSRGQGAVDNRKIYHNTSPPVDRRTGVETLPCPKLRLRAVKIM